MNSVEPGLYQHYKGGFYIVLCEATHSDTKTRHVVFHNKDNPDSIWVRPKHEFQGMVDNGSGSVQRFVKVD